MKPRNKLRFAWWGAEELGLVGSSAYVEDLDDAEANAILAYLNFDMVGSPGGERFVYDGDGSHTGGTWASEGSGEIEARFNAWLDLRGLDYGPTAFDRRSDYAGFLAVGVPSGGLFTGAGSPWDDCYHQACDTTDNIDPVLLGEMAQAAARVTRELSAWEGPLGDGRRARLAASPWDLSGTCHDPAR